MEPQADEPAPAPPMADSPPELLEDEAAAPALLEDAAAAVILPAPEGKSCEELSTTVDPPAARVPRLDEAAREVLAAIARPPRGAVGAAAELRSVEELRDAVAIGADVALATPGPLDGADSATLPALRLARSDMASSSSNETRSNRRPTATLIKIHEGNAAIYLAIKTK